MIVFNFLACIVSELISETKCGLLVKYDNMKQINQAIITLRNCADFRTRLGNNGRRAFLEKYKWDNMEIKLLEIKLFGTYNTLLHTIG